MMSNEKVNDNENITLGRCGLTGINAGRNTFNIYDELENALSGIDDNTINNREVLQEVTALIAKGRKQCASNIEYFSNVIDEFLVEEAKSKVSE